VKSQCARADAPTLMAPPIFTQVSLPSTLTKPAPYAAQELAEVAPFNGSSLPEAGRPVRLMRQGLRQGLPGPRSQGRQHHGNDDGDEFSHFRSLSRAGNRC